MKMRLILLTNLLLALGLAENEILDTSRHILSREKRWLLVWNGGGSNWVQFIFGVGVPLEVKHQSITIGTVIKAFYLLPTNSSVYTRPSTYYGRQARSTSRWTLYKFLESYLDRYHYDGKACLLKSICEVSHSPFEDTNGILAEIVQAILTPSSTDALTDSTIDYHAAEKLGKEGKNCEVLYPECGINLVQQFTSLLS